MDYINTSHPNFIGGTKAVEQAMQTVKSSRIPHPVARPRVWNSLSEINICFMFLFASCEIFRTCSLWWQLGYCGAWEDGFFRESNKNPIFSRPTS